MRAVGVLAGLLAVGCFDPRLPGAITCPSGACPDGLVCDQGICGESLSADAAPTIDAPVASPDAGCLTARFQQGSGGYIGAADTDIAEGAPNEAEGGDPDLSWDAAAATDLFKVALLRFDNLFGTGAGQIPPAMEIASAAIVIRVIGAGDAPPGGLTEVLVDWDENVTWNTLGPLAGIDGDLGPRLVDLPFTLGVHMLDVTATIQSAYDGLPYNGWAFFPEDNDGVDIVSSDGAQADRPLLEIVACPMP